MDLIAYLIPAKLNMYIIYKHTMNYAYCMFYYLCMLWWFNDKWSYEFSKFEVIEILLSWMWFFISEIIWQVGDLGISNIFTNFQGYFINKENFGII